LPGLGIGENRERLVGKWVTTLEMFALPKFVKAFLYIFFQKLYSDFYR